jgi:ATP-dependent helicase/nuclease subunit A
MRDEKLIAEDLQVRSRALDPSLSIALQAPAGSGKTTVLTQRVLALLAVVEEPESILAVTFTRKAAAEMRSRVISALTTVANVLPSEWEKTASPAERVTLGLAQAALRRSQQRNWGLIDSPGRLRIQTIDGLNHRLAMTMPVSARGLAGLRLVDSLLPLYREAARRSLLDAESDLAYRDASQRIFLRLNNDWGRLESLLCTMLATRATWQKAVAGHDDQQLLVVIESSLEKAREQALQELQSALGMSVIREGLELVRHAAENLGERWIPTLDVNDYGNLQALATFALRKESEPVLRSTLNKSQGFPKEQPEIKTRALLWLQELKQIDPRAPLNEIRLLPSKGEEGWDAESFAALAQLLRLALAELQVLFNERGVLDHTAMAATALSAFESSDLVNQERIEHILIDEFQDTSIDQLALLRALTRDWSPGDGRSLFLVGDPMQSIYQFRDADVGLFGYTQRHGVGRISLESLRLTQNFRSTQAIVASINDTFSQIFPQQEDSTRAAVRYVPCIAGKPQDNAVPGTSWAEGVHCHGLLSASSDAASALDNEAKRVVHIVREVWRDQPDAHIAVLVATRRHAPAIVAALGAASINVRGVDLVPLAETPVVLDLIALTRAIHDPTDRIAWLALLRGPACGLTLQEVTIWLEDAETVTGSKIIPACLEHSSISMSQGSKAALRLHRLWQAVRPALQERGALAMRVERAWLRLQGPWCYEEGSTLRDARRYLDHLAKQEQAGQWRGVEDFEWLLKGLYAASDADSIGRASVEVMTVHRAKGLEFDCVILPGLAQPTRHDESELLNLLRWIDHDGQESWVMSAIRSADQQQDEPIQRWVKHRRHQRAQNERVRVLYVAATRAKRALHYVATLDAEQQPRKGTALHALWPALERAFNEPSIAPLAAQAGRAAANADSGNIQSATPESANPPVATPLRRLHRLPVPLKEYLWEDAVSVQSLTRYEVDAAALMRWTWVGDAARRAGTVVHREFERLTRQGSLPTDVERFVSEQRSRWRAALHRAGVLATDLDSMTQRVSVAIGRCLADESGRWVLSRHGPFDEVEFAVSGVVDGSLVNGVLDRCFVDEQGVRWVIDYKSTTHEGGDLEFFLSEQIRRYTPQLTRYARLVSALGPEPVRAGLYFPWLQRFLDLGEL